jgi:serine/threonine-protein kinase
VASDLPDPKRTTAPLAQRLVTTGLLTLGEADASQASDDPGLMTWVVNQGLLPAPLLNQALAGEPLRLGRYEVTGRVGKGGMGAVLEARDESLDRTVALKVLPADAQEDELARFRREAKAQASLNHPNVVRIYAFEEGDGVSFFVMQRVEGPSLEKRLGADGPLAEDEAWRLLNHAVQAMCAAEGVGVLHRDVKPGNILCEGSGKEVTYRLCDFGLARMQREDGRLTQAGYTLGTPAYMRPEQANGQELDARSDMYALGLTLHQALTTEVPFEARGQAIAVTLARRLQEDVPDVREKRPDLTKDMATVLARLCARDREERPRSWRDVLDLLRDHGPLGSSPAAAPAVVRASSGRRKATAPALPMVPLVLAVVAISAVAGVGMAMLGSSGPPQPADVASPAPETTPTPPDADPAEETAPATSEGAPGLADPPGASDAATKTTPPTLEPPPGREGTNPADPSPREVPQAVDLAPITDEASLARALAAARAGDLAAKLAVGRHWVAQRDPRGVEWLTAAVDGGSVEAMVEAAVAHAEGLGVPENAIAARALYQRAARAGHAVGSLRYAEILLADGNPAAAREHLEAAAAKGSPAAMGHLELLAESAGEPAGVAAGWCAKAAQAGDPEAMLRLGLRLIDGRGVTADPAEAKRWLERAGQAGVIAALPHLGRLCSDPAEALGHYTLAAEAGDPEGMTRLGVALLRGAGTERDLEGAAGWLAKAAALGHAEAQGAWGTLLLRGQGTAPDPASGVEWLQKGAEGGDAHALCELGWLHENGEHVAQDDAAAERAYRASVEAGSELAAARLTTWQILGAPEVRDRHASPWPTRTDRPRVLKRWGGGADVEAPVRAALDWLVRHQDDGGRWPASGWGARCLPGDPCRGPGPGNGDQAFDVGLTALATLAFLGQGHDHLRPGPYRPRVRRALRYLLGAQDEGGFVGRHLDRPESMYNHALAALALSEAFGLSGDLQLVEPAQAALEACLRAQSPKKGWKYGIADGRSDTSVTGWMVQALAAGHHAGLASEDDLRESLLGARRWLEATTDRQGRTGYESRGGGSSFLPTAKAKWAPQPVMTAVAVLAHTQIGARKRASEVRDGLAHVLEQAPDGSDDAKIHFYYWYYGAHAVQAAATTTKAKRWAKALERALLPAQRTDGCAAGSWDPRGEWCSVGGRVYATTLAALALEAPYRVVRAK